MLTEPESALQRTAMPTREGGTERSIAARRPSRPILTITLIAINVFVFLIMTVAGGSTKPVVLVAAGALLWTTFQRGDHAALLTSAFIHFGFIHLLVNMYALWVMGRLLERFVGTVRFALVYFVSAVTASLVSVCFIHKAISAGASGAIFGIAGAFFVLGLRYKDQMPPQLIRVSGRGAIPFFVFNLLFGLLVPGINLLAHLGGALGGAACAYVIAPHEDRKWTRRLATGSAVLVTFLAFCAHFVFLVVIGMGMQQLNRARASIAAGDLSAAKSQLDQIAKSHDRDPDFHLLKARWLEARGDNGWAAEEYRTALHLAPQNAEAHHSLGLLLLKQGRLDQAANELRQAAASNPKDANFHVDLGRALLQQDDARQAVSEFREATRLAPDQTATHRALASALLLAGQNTEAKAESEAADRLGRSQAPRKP